ncbi:MAG: TonB-dependent receptor, partial [Pseudomonadales bacterium]|nr:TonB-dependent receptor [Pseudomonadales bacterium]
SDSGCNVGDEFNGGSVEVAGVEVNVEHQFLLAGFSVPLGLAYTYTESAFQESFISGFSQWGEVQQGDELPYLPEHQARLYTGVQANDFDILANIKYTDEMRDLPGQASFDENQSTPELLVVDLSASYYFDDNWTAQLTIDNILDTLEPVSYRPFGARPNKPRTTTATVKYRF